MSTCHSECLHLPRSDRPSRGAPCNAVQTTERASSDLVIIATYPIYKSTQHGQREKVTQPRPRDHPSSRRASSSARRDTPAARTLLIPSTNQHRPVPTMVPPSIAASTPSPSPLRATEAARHPHRCPSLTTTLPRTHLSRAGLRRPHTPRSPTSRSASCAWGRSDDDHRHRSK